MSVILKNMNMPENCGKCFLAGMCGVHSVEEWPDLESIMYNDVIGVDGVRDPDCPLVPVPPHGRLIDADALMKSDRMVGKLMMFGGEYVYTQSEIDRAQTVIPAEEGE